jgi:RNA-binding protein
LEDLDFFNGRLPTSPALHLRSSAFSRPFAYTPAMIPLSSKRRSELRAEAHKLHPVVLIGDKGLTDEVVAEIDRSLRTHELIKVRAGGSDREARGAWLATICERLQAYPVQQIGKVFVIYRENPEEAAAPRRAPRGGPAGEERKPGKRPVVVTARGKQRQRTRDDKKRRERDIQDMIRKGKIAAKDAARGLKTGTAAEAGGSEETVKRTSRPRSRTPSPPLESAPPKRRPRTSR